jgi:hypothetical protein
VRRGGPLGRNPPGFLVLTGRDHRIAQIAVGVPGPHTAEGIQVGSTYGELKAAYPTLTAPVPDGYDQFSAYPPGEEDGRPYLQFLFGAYGEPVTDATPITLIAVTDGEKAYFQYDC